MLNTPTVAREQPKYDSDGSSSMVSEPGSPQDVSMSDDDGGMGAATFSQSPEDRFITQPRPATQSPWGQRLRTERVPTPAVPMRPGASSPRVRHGPKQHVRRRHPQQNSSGSDHLEVPSPIDEDEVPTPPSAAEAAGSQLSQLTVSDVDMDATDSVPTISIDPARPPSVNTSRNMKSHHDSVVDFDPMDSGGDGLVVRKQRQRSGALSSGNSPVRVSPGAPANTNTHKRGFSMGFRADCEKCRMRVPGHMNHFL